MIISERVRDVLGGNMCLIIRTPNIPLDKLYIIDELIR